MEKELIKNMRSAIKNNNLDGVKKLISDNESLLDTDTVFGTWLHIAALEGKKEIAEYLIVECDMDVNKNGGISGGNPLCSAAEKGYLDMVELLYRKGAKLDVSEPAKNPLFAAIYGGYFGIVKFLVEHEIDITASYPIGQLDNVDAYEYATQYGQTDIANYLKLKFENGKYV